MPEVSLTVLIIAAAVSLFIGFGAAFLIQNSKITSMRAELDHAQKEEQAYAKAAETASQKCEAFAEESPFCIKFPPFQNYLCAQSLDYYI